MLFYTLIIPRKFAEGPKFDEDGELIKNSWPSGQPLPKHNFKLWDKLGVEKGARYAVDVAVVDEDEGWIDSIAGGWQGNSRHHWDERSKHQYDEDGNMTASGLEVIEPVDRPKYNDHQPQNDDGSDPVYARMAVVVGIPKIDQADEFNEAQL